MPLSSPNPVEPRLIEYPPGASYWATMHFAYLEPMVMILAWPQNLS